MITDVNPATTSLPNPLPSDWYTYSWSARLADSTITRYRYDELGRLTAQTNGSGLATLFDYDVLDRRRSRTLPGKVRQNGRDVTAIEYWYPDYNSPAIGAKLNQLRSLDLNGRYVLNRSDLMGRVIERRPDGLLGWASALPAGGNVPVTFTYTATGQRNAMTDASGTTRYAYDDRDRLRIKQSAPGTIYYDYDAAGNVTEINAQYGYTFASSTDTRFDLTKRSATATRSSGAFMSYQYDDRNRLWKTFDAAGAGTPVATHGFHPAGSLASVAYVNNVTTAYDYNVRNQLRRIRTVNPGGTLLANYDYDEAGSAAAIGTLRNSWGARLLSNSGRRNRLIESGTSSATIDYDYDNLNRLAKEAVGSDYLQYDGGAGYESTGYDILGNRRSRSRPVGSTRYPNSVYGTSATTSYAYDQNDRLDNDTSATSASTLFDGNGNTTTFNSVTYAYDFENRLLSSSAGSVTMTYDGDGNRVKKVSTGGTTFYLIDDRNPTGYAQALEEQATTAASAPTVTYVYGLQRVNQKCATGTFYYGYDGLGSVRYLTTKTVSGFTDGAVSDTYNYDDYGVKLPSSTGSTLNNYRFAAEYSDTDLSMSYNRARFYHFDTGRFWTMDTFQGHRTDPLSLHKYLYAHSDPVNRIDPSGHFDVVQTLVTASLVGTISALTTPWTVNAPGPHDPVYPAVTGEEYLANFTIGAVTYGAGVGVGAAVRGTGRGIRGFVSKRIGAEADGVIGRVNPPAGLKPGTTTFGNEMHKRIADLLKKKYPDVQFTFRIKPGPKGVDIEVPDEYVDFVGFKYGEIKPRTPSGERTFNTQVDDWGLPSEVRAITYDEKGNLYEGF